MRRWIVNGVGVLWIVGWFATTACAPPMSPTPAPPTVPVENQVTSKEIPAPSPGTVEEESPRMVSPKPARDSELPAYPWPPEAPSWRVDLGQGDGTGKTSQLDVWTHLKATLSASGYLEWGVYEVPGGFAAVTRLEAIDSTGKPLAGAERFAPPDRSQTFSLSTYLSQLFFAPEGKYRFVVFVVTDQPFTTAAKTLAENEAVERLERGASSLPSAYGQLPFSGAHTLHALIYEFEKKGENVAISRPGSVAPNDHVAALGYKPLTFR